VCVVVHALYGLKLAGASWCATLAQAPSDIGFVTTIADSDVWIQPAACEDGHKYYKMLLVYVDNALAISHELKVLIDAIGEYYKIKPRSDKKPDIYLGANVEKVQMPDGRKFGLHLLAITSRMLSRLLRDYLGKMEKGTY
jgi:hypothetical protein